MYVVMVICNRTFRCCTSTGWTEKHFVTSDCAGAGGSKQYRHEHYHAGKPNSPFSAKILPFSAKTPVLGKISPFAVQSSRAIFSIGINVAKEKQIVIEISGRFVKKVCFIRTPIYLMIFLSLTYPHLFCTLFKKSCQPAALSPYDAI